MEGKRSHEIFMKKYRRAKRRILGQHFLKSAGVLEKIIGVIDPLADDLIIEIGAGRGALTFPLAALAGKVLAIEKDRAFVPFLEEKGPPNLAVVAKDALDVNFKELVGENGILFGRAKLVGNLPYSISSPLLFKVIEERAAFRKCVFLVQKEVAERVCAGPGSKSYAPVSILLQLHFQAALVLTVHPGSFSPPPRVQSALITLDRRPSPLHPVSDERKFLRFLRACFKQRRKTLVNNLVASGTPVTRAEEACSVFGLDRSIRPEQVSIAQFVGLFDFFHGRP
jgi:16S rRNA (adenine1518-N6/adenine1519-N6)-dimethyltransferase